MFRGEQMSLFSSQGEPSCDASFSRLERIELEDGAWIDLARGWVSNDAALFACLRDRTRWRAESRTMYDREVDVPRLYAELRSAAVHPVLTRIREALDARYETELVRMSAALYRNGEDSVAWHGDYVARRMDEALVATISLGAPRKFLLRKTGGGPSRAWSIGHGDLVVMGGTCQRTYQHAVPKVTHAGARIALMFRPIWTAPPRGQPET